MTDMRERLIELLTDNLPHCDNPLQGTYDEIVERLANYLIANGVQIVRHGKPIVKNRPEKHEVYKPFPETINGSLVYVKEIHFNSDNPTLYCYSCGKRLCSRFTDYCPNCGAKMDLE